MLKNLGTAARRLLFDATAIENGEFAEMASTVRLACQAIPASVPGLTVSRGLDDASCIHPGRLLREVVFPALRLNIAEAAASMGIVRQTLHRVTSERAGISSEMALRIGRLTGTDPIIWLRLQAVYDLAEAEKRIGREIGKIQVSTPPRRY